MNNNKDLIISKYKEFTDVAIHFLHNVAISKLIYDSNKNGPLVETYNKLTSLKSELSLLQEQEEKELPIDKSYVAMNKVNEICDKAERDIELENKLIDFANWYLRLIKVTTDKDERYEIENREMIWSFLRGDDYKLWWNKFGESVDQSGIRDELIKYAKWYYNWKEYATDDEHIKWVVDEYLKAK